MKSARKKSTCQLILSTGRPAFTLVELLVVIAIVGLLSGVAIVSLNNSRDKAKIATGQSFDQSIRQGLGDQLIGEWLMNECAGNVAADVSGSGNTATFIGGASWSTSNAPGNSGCSANLTGPNYLSTSLNLQSPNVTYTAWVYPTNVTGYNSITAKELQYKYMIYNGNLFAGVSCNGTSWNTILTGSPVPTNTWSMVALVMDSANSTVKLFMNGRLAAQGSGCVPTAYNGNLTAIGSDYPNSAAYPFRGNIDDVRIYTSALSLSQIEKMYAEGLPNRLFVKSR